MAVVKKKPYRYQLWLLIISGTLCALCEGFDSIVALLGLFFTTPGVLVCAVGLVFAVISSIIFYSIDLHEVAAQLDLGINASRAALDNAITELDHLTDEYAVFEKKIFQTTSPVVLNGYLIQVNRLLKRYEALEALRRVYREALDNAFLCYMKKMMSLLASVLFFGNGFFAAQAVVLFFIPTCLMTWPALIFCSVVGCSSCWVHWAIDGPDIENIISSWFGFDSAKLEQLFDDNEEHVTTNKLKSLMDHIQHNQKICQENMALRAEVTRLQGSRGLRLFDGGYVASDLAKNDELIDKVSHCANC